MDNLLVKDIIDKDIYSIEEYHGEKFIHLWGFFGYGDNWYSTECCGCNIPLQEFIEQYDQNGEGTNIWLEWCKQYQRDFETEEEAQIALDDYFGETVFPIDDPHAPSPLLLSEVTMDTPCGDYIDL